MENNIKNKEVWYITPRNEIECYRLIMKNNKYSLLMYFTENELEEDLEFRCEDMQELYDFILADNEYIFNTEEEAINKFENI